MRGWRYYDILVDGGDALSVRTKEANEFTKKKKFTNGVFVQCVILYGGSTLL